MNSQYIEKTLVERGEYTESQAALITKDLMQIDSMLMPSLSKWIKDGVETDFSVEGFTLYGIKSKYNMTYPAALLTMDWLVKEPNIAKEAIKHGLK